jgi:diaminopimelate decarboxylase
MTPNTHKAPLTYKEQAHDIEIGGVSTASLIQQFGSPLYVLDEATIKAMCKAYIEAFSSYPESVTILYAAKANLSIGLAALIHQYGLGIDVVSAGEYATVKQAQVPTERLLMNGNNKTEEELAYIIEQGIGRISVDNAPEIELLASIARKQGKTVNILLRVTPGIECHTHEYIKTGRVDSKFGIPLTDLPAVVETILTEYADVLTLKGLHAHIGSQIFEQQVYRDLPKVMLGLMQDIRNTHGLTLPELNLGGGLGIVYHNQDDPPSVQSYISGMLDSLQESAHALNYPLPQLYIEPGRSIVATAGVTLYRVGTLKEIREIDKTYVSVDGGMGDNIRPALYGAEYSALIANKPKEPCTKKVTIAGKYCESGDILLRDFAVPASIERGDTLMVFGTGAYNYTMASNYNRVPRPAMVLVKEGQAQLLIQRETLAHMMALDLLPSMI